MENQFRLSHQYVTAIGELPQTNSALFSAPENGEFWEMCDEMREAKPLDQPKPQYPPEAHGAGVAIFYAVIEADGHL